jgi:hypothetical protein
MYCNQKKTKIVIIETISNLILPGTLAVHLTANIIAGHILLTLLGNNGPSIRYIINCTNYCTNPPLNPRSSSSSYSIICICNPKNLIFYRREWNG